MPQEWKPPCGTWTSTGVSDANLGEVIAGYKADSAKTVTKVKQADGKWTVIAVFDPCTDGQAQATIKQHS